MRHDKPASRMTEQEYLRRLENIQSIVAEGAASDEAADALNARCASLEFDLAIDYRLGQDYPHERRRKLHFIRELFEHEKGELVQQFTQGRMGEEVFRNRLQGLVDAMAARYAEILTPQEYRALIGPITGIIAPIGHE